MKLPTWNKLNKFQKEIENQHNNLIKLFPEMVWKFYTTECVKNSILDEIIDKYKIKAKNLW